MYIFFEKQDQLTMCERIFAKTLVMTAGSNKIVLNGQEISHMSAITLWLSSASDVRSISFCPNLTMKKVQVRDLDFQIHDLWAADKASRNPRTLTIIAESMSSGAKSSYAFTPLEDQPDGRLGTSFFGRASSTISSKWKKPGRLRCSIEFTRLSDRTSFVNYLQ